VSNRNAVCATAINKRPSTHVRLRIVLGKTTLASNKCATFVTEPASAFEGLGGSSKYMWPEEGGGVTKRKKLDLIFQLVKKSDWSFGVRFLYVVDQYRKL
jgi:hypothetical protein